MSASQVAVRLSSRRAHDLVDLQLIFRKGGIDLEQTRETCKRLFAYRRRQPWPPVIGIGTGWEPLYAEAAEGLPVIQDVSEAIDWVNRIIVEIAD